MTLQRLSREDFTDTQVVHSTGIELDIIQYIYEFCIENVQGFDQTWAYEECLDFLNGVNTCQEDLSYFVHESLYNFMTTIAPLGTYFGSHQGDSTLGFWSVLDFDSVLEDFDQVKKLPYTRKGYVIFEQEARHGVFLDGIDSFLTKYYPDLYRYSELETVITELVTGECNSESDRYLAYKIKVFFMASIFPRISPKWHAYRQNEHGEWGLFLEFPTYKIIHGSREEIETTNLIMESSYFVKLAYIVENRQGEMLRLPEYNNLNWLNDLCLAVMNEAHFVPFYQVLEKFGEFNYEQIGQYLAQHYHARKWVINHVYWDTYKAKIDQILGKQDVTYLWHGCVENGINGITEEVYNLRESCPDCHAIPYSIDNPEWADKSCSCQGYDMVNNVWLVYYEFFYNELAKHGAMVFESDNYLWFLQTDHDGYGDSLLHKAWLTTEAHGYFRLLKSNTTE